MQAYSLHWLSVNDVNFDPLSKTVVVLKALNSLVCVNMLRRHSLHALPNGRKYIALELIGKNQWRHYCLYYCTSSSEEASRSEIPTW